MLGNEHHSDRQPVAQAAGDAHGGMASEIGRRVVSIQPKGVADNLLAERVGRRHGRGHTWHGRHQQKVVARKHCVVSGTQPPNQVLRLGVITAVVRRSHYVPGEHGKLERL